MTPPQTYELTLFSTMVVLFLGAIFLLLCIKLVLTVIQKIIDLSQTGTEKATEPGTENEESEDADLTNKKDK